MLASNISSPPLTFLDVLRAKDSVELGRHYLLWVHLFMYAYTKYFHNTYNWMKLEMIQSD